MAKALRSRTQTLKGRLKEQSDFIPNKKPEKLLQTRRLHVVEVASNESKYIRKYDLIPDRFQPDKTEKVVLVMGPTGSGKTTLMNVIANYVLGVEFKDEMRFILVKEKEKESQTESQTEGITSYTLRHQRGYRIPFTLTLVDTPGYGDTRGMEWDQKITENIKDFFSSKGEPYSIDSISAVFFVVKSNDTRLGAKEMYVYESILKLFGKNIESNIIPIFTFSDRSDPIALDAFKELRIPCQDYFKINSSDVFEKPGRKKSDDYDNLQKAWRKWEMTIGELLDKINRKTNKSLTLTNEVLEDRERLHTKVNGLYDKIQEQIALLAKMESLETDLDGMAGEYSEEFEKTQVKTPNLHRQYTLVCNICEIVCHKKCKVGFKPFGRLCSVIEKGKCKICSCDAGKHVSVKYKSIYKIESKEAEKNMIGIAKKISATKEDLRKTFLSYEQVQEKLVENIGLANTINQRLSTIAMKPNTFTEEEYIEWLIQKEQTTEEPGWEARIEELRKIQEKTALVKSVIVANSNV